MEAELEVIKMRYMEKINYYKDALTALRKQESAEPSGGNLVKATYNPLPK